VLVIGAGINAAMAARENSAPAHRADRLYAGQYGKLLKAAGLASAIQGRRSLRCFRLILRRAHALEEMVCVREHLPPASPPFRPASQAAGPRARGRCHGTRTKDVNLSARETPPCGGPSQPVPLEKSPARWSGEVGSKDRWTGVKLHEALARVAPAPLPRLGPFSFLRADP
jgi:hypothetical protein